MTQLDECKFECRWCILLRLARCQKMNVIVLPFRVNSPSAALQRFAAPELLHMHLSQCTSISSIQNMPPITLGKFTTIKPVLLANSPERTEYIVSYTRVKTVYRSTETGEESVAYSWQYKVWGRVKRNISYLSSPSVVLPAEAIIPLPSLLEQTALYPTPRLHRIYLLSTPKPQGNFDWMIDYDTPAYLQTLPPAILTQSSVAMLTEVLFAIRPVWTVDMLYRLFQKRVIFTLLVASPVAKELKCAAQYLNQLESIDSDNFCVERVASQTTEEISYKVTLRYATRSQCVTAVQQVAYTYTNGPWRYVWIRRGLDIRHHPHLGLQAKSVDVRFRGELLEQLKSIIKTKSGNDYRAFVTSLPRYLLAPFEAVFKPGPSLLQNYNRCICDLPREMIAWDGEALLGTCTKQRGFCTQQYLDYVRSQFLNYINSVVNEIAAIYSPVSGQLISNDSTRLETKFLELNQTELVSQDLIDALKHDNIPYFDCTLCRMEPVEDQKDATIHSVSELDN